jgi:ribonuclease M5
MIHIKEVIVVEGRYDKNTVSQVVDGTIIETDGFGIFSDKEKLALLRKLAEKRGLIILTDSDRAGFFIRGRLKGILGSSNIKHAYIPGINGREKRKSTASTEGKLGVEGMVPEIIIKSLERAGATFEEGPVKSERPGLITGTDMFSTGLSGGAGSAQKRRDLLKRLDLPERLSTRGLLDVLNILFSRDEFLDML